MNKEFIPYEQALELKQLGFDGADCLAIYNINKELETGHYHNNYVIDAPLYQQAFRWFRDKYNIQSKIEVTSEYDTPKKNYYLYQIVVDYFIYGYGIDYSWTYEEAELACLNKLIEIVKNK